MVKLQKRFAYNYKGKNHFKHQIIIPEDIIDKLGWEDGIELEPVLDNDSIVLRKIRKSEK